MNSDTALLLWLQSRLNNFTAYSPPHPKHTSEERRKKNVEQSWQFSPSPNPQRKISNRSEHSLFFFIKKKPKYSFKVLNRNVWCLLVHVCYVLPYITYTLYKIYIQIGIQLLQKKIPKVKLPLVSELLSQDFFLILLLPIYFLN